MKTHRDLLAWQEAMRLASLIYASAGRLPDHERFGLAQQMRRAAVSIPSNIAEGAARHSPSEFCYFLSVSLGSLAELDTQIELACRLGCLAPDTGLEAQRQRVAQLTTRLRQAMRQRLANRSPITDHDPPS